MKPEQKQLKPVLLASMAGSLMIFVAAGAALGATTAPDGSPPDVAEDRVGLIQDLLALTGSGGSLGAPDEVVEGLLAHRGEVEAFSPSTTVTYGKDILDGLSAAGTGSEAFAAAASVAGQSVDPTVRAPTLEAALVGLYERMGASTDAASITEIHVAASGLDTPARQALAILVDAVVQGFDAVDAGDGAAMFDAAGTILQATESAQSLFPQSQASSASSGCPAPPIFEDPEGFVIVRGTCDDTYTQHRVIQVDLGGQDTYNNNAGGANVASGSIIDPKVTLFPDLVDDIQDAVTPIVLSPLTEGLLNDEAIDQMVLNQTWQNETIDDLPGRVDATVNNNTGALDVPGIVADAILDCPNTCNVDPGLNSTNARKSLRAALSLDLGSGNDLYENSESIVQGAGLGGIGVLVDSGGDDEYVAANSAQGFGASGGMGVLVDMDGTDTYSGVGFVQASSDGGFLFDLGTGGDTYSATGFGSQGGRVVPFPAGPIPSLLFDAGGSDTYTAGGDSQGAGNFLVDALGDDTYTVVGASSPSFVDGFAQGAGFLHNPGFLIDGAGDDTYSADIFAAQAFSIGNGMGALLDFEGDDTYSNTGFGQATCASQASVGALLFDGEGDDTYTAGGSGQGSSQGPCTAILVDAGGDDIYSAGTGSQGAAFFGGLTFLTPVLGILFDAGGDDTYEAGDDSQGSGSGGGAGLLIDADGSDSYAAGSGSQGSGGSGVGILVDGLQGVVHAEVDADLEADSLSVGGTVIIPGDTSRGDTLTAGDFSQGSSGSHGGIGLLIDNDDERDVNGKPFRGTYTAGDFSQGASTALGLGALVNREGRDDYSAGIVSQGSSKSGAVGLLADLDGRDSYTVSDESQSRGYGNTTSSGPAFGLLLDTDNDMDEYSGFPGFSHNNMCESKGTAGLTVDTSVGTVPAGCDTAALDALTGLATALLFVQPGGPGPCTGTSTEYFCDDVEGGTSGWVVSNGMNEWRVVNQSVTRQPFGPNAHSGENFWYVGAPGVPGIAYVTNDGTVIGPSTLTSPAVDLTSASNPELTAFIAGSSEADFDFLSVGIQNATGTTFLERYSGERDYGSGIALNVSAYAGQTVQVVFEFSSDLFIEEGQGWNVDDIRVAEA